MLKPICTSCKLFYRPSKNGIYFIEGAPINGGNWTPYKLWMGDEWKCRGCSSTIIVGTGREPVSEHFRPDFDEYVQTSGVTLQINDC